MDASSGQWIADLDMKMMERLDDEYNISVCSESLSSCTTDPYLSFDHQRPTKLMKTSSGSWGSYNSNNDSSPSSTCHLLSFSNINSEYSSKGLMLQPKLEVDYESNNPIFGEIYGVKHSNNINQRSNLVNQEHVIAEQRRRQKLSQRLIALSALIPGLKKMDKASVLEEAARYMKELQERIRNLEEKVKERNVKSVILKKTRLSMKDNNVKDEDANSSVFPEIQVRVMDKELLLIIHCENQKGLLAKVFNEMEKLHFCVTNTNSMPFGSFDFIITLTAQIKADINISPRELVTKLRAVL